MFFIGYMWSELRRRRGRTILTALGLAVGVAVVVVVNALSTGLDQAQSRVLEPLTGVGTDMTVTRPIKITSNGSGLFGGLSPSQQNKLRSENGGPLFNLRTLGKPGAKFSTDTFRPDGNLSFTSDKATSVKRLAGVAAVAPSLTLTDMHVYGTIPKITVTQTPGSNGFNGSPSTNGQGGGGFRAAFGNNKIHVTSRTITGVDTSQPGLAAVTPSQITRGKYLPATGGANDAVLSSTYAASSNLKVGSTFKIGKKRFTVIGLASAPLGGTASDIYIPLATLQKMAGYKGQITGMQVEADSGGQVNKVSGEIKQAFSGAQVTTASDLAKRVGGSLTDAKHLAGSLGRALEIVGLLGAVLIAVLLTLASVAKRVREIGTLKAIGWTRWQVTRQIGGEALAQGLFGGALGIVLGLVGIAVVNAVGWTLKASVPAASTGFPGAANGPSRPGGGGFGPFGFGQSAVTSGSELVKVTASASTELIVAAICLAAAGGLVAGVAGGLRAARLRPAAALRTIE